MKSLKIIFQLSPPNALIGGLVVLSLFGFPIKNLPAGRQAFGNDGPLEALHLSLRQALLMAKADALAKRITINQNFKKF